LRLHLKPDKTTLLKLSVRSADSEFQIVGAAWQNARLPKTVLTLVLWCSPSYKMAYTNVAQPKYAESINITK